MLPVVLLSQRGPASEGEVRQREVCFGVARLELDREPQETIGLPPVVFLPVPDGEKVLALRVVRVLAGPRFYFLELAIEDGEPLALHRAGRGEQP